MVQRFFRRKIALMMKNIQMFAQNLHQNALLGLETDSLSLTNYIMFVYLVRIWNPIVEADNWISYFLPLNPIPFTFFTQIFSKRALQESYEIAWTRTFKPHEDRTFASKPTIEGLMRINMIFVLKFPFWMSFKIYIKVLNCFLRMEIKGIHGKKSGS